MRSPTKSGGRTHCERRPGRDAGERQCRAMANDQSGDVFSDDERATAQRLIDEIDEFNLKATGIAEFHEMLIAETDDDGELIAGVYGWCWGGHAGSRRSGCARTCGVAVSEAGCSLRRRKKHDVRVGRRSLSNAHVPSPVLL